MQERNYLISDRTSVDSTIGACGFLGVIVKGSADVGTTTILDGTDIKFSVDVTTTADGSLIIGSPIAFTNLIVDNTGTGGYSVIYQPRP